MESLKTKCRKVLIENINLQKTNDLPKKGLRKRTLLLIVEKLKEKNLKKYPEYLQKFNFIVSRYDNNWRKSIFHFATGKDHKGFKFNRILNNDIKIQKNLIEREFEHKKYLKKFDYDIKKAFLEFFQDLNKVMFFPLSRKYQDFDFVNRVTDKKNVNYLMHYNNWFLFQQMLNFRKNLPKYRVKYFRDLTEKIKDEDFDKYITEIENICQNEMSYEF